jgi:NAD kinase
MIVNTLRDLLYRKRITSLQVEERLTREQDIVVVVGGGGSLLFAL